MFAQRRKRLSAPPHRIYTSRLTKKERGKNLRTMILMSLLTASLLGALIYWGLPIMKSFTSWWTQVPQGTKESDDKIPPTIPRLLITNKTSKEQTIEIKGFAEPDSTVTMVVNGEAMSPVEVDASGQFNIQGVTLMEGENEISAYAKDKAGNESQLANTEKVTFDNKPPDLEISSPQNGSVMRGSQAQTVEITGKVNEEARVWINERLVIVNQGGFQYAYRLSEGSQDLVIKAIDHAGNETSTTLSLTYQP